MWNRIARIENAPLGHTAKDNVVLNLCDYIWLISRDDGTPVMVAGLYKPIAVGGDNIIWMAPYPSLRPWDFRGMKKLMDLLKAGIPNLTAIVDVTQTAAVRTVEHLGFVLEKDGHERVYKWQS